MGDFAFYKNIGSKKKPREKDHRHSAPATKGEKQLRQKNMSCRSDKEDPWAEYNIESENLRLELEKKHDEAFGCWSLEAAISSKCMAQQLQLAVQKHQSCVFDACAVRSLVQTVPEVVYELRSFPRIPVEKEMRKCDAEDCIYIVLRLAEEAELFWKTKDSKDGRKTSSDKGSGYQLKILSGTSRLCM